MMLSPDDYSALCYAQTDRPAFDDVMRILFVYPCSGKKTLKIIKCGVCNVKYVIKYLTENKMA